MWGHLEVRMILVQPRPDLAISSSKRYLCKSASIKPLYIDGVKYCAWCGKNPTRRKALKYCSDDCRDSSTMFCNPHSYAMKGYLLHQQDYKCDCCKHDYKELLLKYYPVIEDTYWALYHNYRKIAQKLYSTDKAPELHHRHPIHKGGNGVGVDNLVIICKECHKMERK